MAKIDVPYFVWRDGRPRWVPGPQLRARGFKGRDLKDVQSKWLAFGDAIDEAKKLNAAAAAQQRGEDLPAPAHIKLMRQAFAAYEKSDNFKSLKKRTAQGYRQHIALLEEWCGDIPIEAVTRAAIRDFHRDLRESRGLSQANAVLRTLKIVLYYAVNDLEWTDRNRAARIRPGATDGRLVLWTPEEIAAFVAAADAIGCESQADALLLGLLTGQRQGDILALRECVMADGFYRVEQQKRGHTAFVPLTRPLLLRIEQMRKRKAERWPNVTHTLELISTQTGKPYADESVFREEFRAVRAIAAGGLHLVEALAGRPAPNLTPVPSVIGKKFADLRDTAVTWLCAAGCTVAEVANITGHSLETVQKILDKHYFVRNEQLAASAGAKLDAYLTTLNIGG